MVPVLTRYQPYGQPYWQWGATRTDFGFTGQRLDGFGLMDYNARYYSSTLGRFVSPDTYVPESQGVQAWDRYAYINNNPVNGTDSTGHCIDGISTYFCIIAAGAVVGALVSYGTQVAGNIAENGWSGEAFTDVDGASIAAAAVAGAVGVGVGLAGAAMVGTGLVATVATGAVGGVISGQASRATTNILTGQDIGSGLGNPTDMLIDGALGGVMSGVGYGAGKILQSSFHTGDFPTNSSSRYLLRKSGAGGEAGFAEYNPATTRANYRVDLEGSAHGGVATPHSQQALWNTPPGGQPRFNGWGGRPGVNLFPYNQIKATIISTYIRLAE